VRKFFKRPNSGIFSTRIWSFFLSANQLSTTAESENEIASGQKSLKKLGQALEFIADGHSLEEVIALQTDQKERAANFVELLNLAKVHRRFEETYWYKGAEESHIMDRVYHIPDAFYRRLIE
jgi:ATP-dependent RNA circularization protein (DNA/RNA ligase family)